MQSCPLQLSVTFPLCLSLKMLYSFSKCNKAKCLQGYLFMYLYVLQFFMHIGNVLKCMYLLTMVTCAFMWTWILRFLVARYIDIKRDRCPLQIIDWSIIESNPVYTHTGSCPKKRHRSLDNKECYQIPPIM